MRILGIDPGYATIGFGLIKADRGQVHMGTYGAITTPADCPFRAGYIRSAVTWSR